MVPFKEAAWDHLGFWLLLMKHFLNLPLFISVPPIQVMALISVLMKKGMLVFFDDMLLST